MTLEMAADASAYGVGAVIYPDGSEKPVAFASHTLMKSLKNYAQNEKEVLALISPISLWATFHACHRS